MRFIECPNCGKQTGHKRMLGIGTLLAVIVTGGLWLVALPGYPVRCMVCGAVEATARSPIMAVVLSGLFPGLGQIYNHQWFKALLFGVGAALTGFGPLSPLDVNIDLDDPAAGLRKALLLSAPFLAIALWSVIDAYRTAKRTAGA